MGGGRALSNCVRCSDRYIVPLRVSTASLYHAFVYFVQFCAFLRVVKIDRTYGAILHNRAIPCIGASPQLIALAILLELIGGSVLGQTFRIALPTGALRLEHGRQICITGPEGSMITAKSNGNPSCRGNLVDVPTKDSAR